MFLRGKKIKRANNAFNNAVELFLRKNFLSQKDFQNLSDRQKKYAVKLMLKIEGIKLKRSQIKEFCAFFEKPISVIKNNKVKTVEVISHIFSKALALKAFVSYELKDAFKTFVYFVFSFRLTLQKILRV